MSSVLFVSSGNHVLRPLARNLLRTAVLLYDYEVHFEWKNESQISIEAGETFDQTEEILCCLEAQNPCEPIGKDLSLLMIRLAKWLENPETEQNEEILLSEYLEEMRRQSVCYMSGNPEQKFSDFWDRWELFYPVPQTFHVMGTSVINETNRNEAEDYIAAHTKAAEGVKSIDQAIDSLRACIPLDVETILDVGSGPGYVDERLPADYSILAMDIDAEILRDNKRQSCVGDIMDIPLTDESVDMTMACDTLEHLPDDVLIKGLAEMERVSRKYLYLQVPFQEDPLVGFAHCPKCGNVWHVNHHKRAFDENNLRALVSDNWEAVLVNFTGDVSYRRNGLIPHDLASALNRDIYCAEDQTCPNCGEKSKTYGEADLSTLQQIAHFDADTPFPIYSEIGILFVRKGTEAYIPKTVPVKGFHKESGNLISVHEKLLPELVYTGTEQLPALYLSGCTVETNVNGCFLKRDPKTETAWVAFAFPPAYRNKSNFEMKGALSKPGQVHVSLLDGAGAEHYRETWNLDKEEKQYILPLSNRQSFQPYYVKLYFQSEFMCINGCNITGEGGRTFREYLNPETTFLSFCFNEVEYRLYAPKGENLHLSHSPGEWLIKTMDVHKRSVQAAFRFAEVLKDKFSQAADSDNRRLITASSVPEKVQENGIEETDNRRLIATSFIPESNRESGAEESDQRRIISNSILAEAEIQAYHINTTKQLRQRIRGKGVNGLKKITRRLHGWLHHHEKLYEVLINLRLKAFYMKIKRRIKA